MALVWVMKHSKKWDADELPFYYPYLLPIEMYKVSRKRGGNVTVTGKKKTHQYIAKLVPLLSLCLKKPWNQKKKIYLIIKVK